jgi:multiple sugar transport system substrate-binding protein
MQYQEFIMNLQKRKISYCLKLMVCSLILLVTHLFINPTKSLAGEQAERAISAVKKLVETGEIAKGATIKLLVKQGNINNFWGDNFEIKIEWEERTGILIDAEIMPQRALLENIKESKDTDIDIMVARQLEYPDLYTGNYIADLTPFVKKYKLVFDDNPVNGYILPKAQTEFDNKVVAIPADGDILVVYLRKDLMDDPVNKEAFKKKYNRDLTIPETWDEYQNLIEFFHNYRDGFYGSCEQRDPSTGWMFWMPRYVCRANPNQYLFDENMHPLINSSAGVAATESYLATIPFSPPDVLKEDNDYNYTMPFFKNGNGFSSIITLAGAKVYNLESSAVKSKFTCVPIPGAIVGDRLVKRPSFVYGNNLVVANTSKHKELAFLFAMWFSDPDVSIRSVLVTSGIADPYRMNHLTDARVRSIYTKQVLDTLAQQIPITIPAGTGLPGDAEYIQALNKNLLLAGKGKLTAKEAMEQTAQEWEAITEKYGREKQIRYLHAFIENFPRESFPVSPNH